MQAARKLTKFCFFIFLGNFALFYFIKISSRLNKVKTSLNIVTDSLIPFKQALCKSYTDKSLYSTNGKFYTRTEYSENVFVFPVTFCVKPPEEDAYVSTKLAMGKGWEPDLVTKVMEAMTLHPEAVFLDLGSNVGAYTLPVASMRRRVVAVDMMRDNLAYIKTSLAQAGLESYVEMVNNAVRCEY